MLILITNNTLADRAGTELYVRDLARGLLNRGHTPVAYSSRLGEVANELGAAGVRVVDDLEMVTDPPDIIHGHHHLDTMTAVLHFPSTPAIFVCHGSTPWEEGAPQFPRILRYLAVDHACRDRLVIDHEIPQGRVRVVLNFVDLERFKPRGKLPDRPQRALIFSNQANEFTYVPAVRAACENSGLLLDVVGRASGNACAEPEAVLGNYDIIFAKGRSALEALAVGTAVVLCDAAGSGPMVTTSNVAQLRPLNFGIRALREALNAEVISREIARYDPTNATTVSGHIRATAGRDEVIDELLSLYHEVIDEYSQMPEPNRVAEQRAVATYLRDLAARLFQRDHAMQRLAMTENELEVTRAQLEMIRNSRSWRMVTRYAAMKQKLLGPVQSLPGAPHERVRGYRILRSAFFARQLLSGDQRVVGLSLALHYSLRLRIPDPLIGRPQPGQTSPFLYHSFETSRQRRKPGRAVR